MSGAGQDVTEETTFPSDKGVCDLCEKRPVAPDDIFCAECRQEVYEASEVVTDPLERLINQHGLCYPLLNIDVVKCYCGKEWKGGAGYHRHHLAEVILEHFGMAPPSPWMPAPEYDRLHPEEVARQDAETAFLDASVAVWREIDAAMTRGPYKGIDVTEEGRQLRLAEREAWDRYKAVLDAE